LLRQLVGLEHAPEARRWLEGQEYARKELAEWRARVTLAAQDAPILDDTVERNLAFPYGFRTAARRELPVSDAQELLERCGLGSIAFNQRVAVLSGGERHRLALVRAVLWDPVVLVADEPLAGLDSGVAETCWQLLGEHAHRSGRAVLCTLHDDTMAERADRRVELSDGSIRELEVRSP
jgi:ABC-type lipoprotein export system ATPase subunit